MFGYGDATKWMEVAMRIVCDLFESCHDVSSAGPDI